ncbi:MAG: hypothetical protein ACAH24_14765 [Hyphomicrobiaceae bacterium]|jgi:hypothetical protein
MPPILLAIVLAWLALVPATLAQSKKPAVPPGRDPGGVAVALLSGGIDYTLPQIAGRLARDGEGELIGWDVEAKDRLPFSGEGKGTAVALALLGSGDARLVAVRVNPADPISLGRGIAFVAHTPARLAVLATLSLAQDNWEPLRQSAAHFKGILIIAPAEGASSIPPSILALDNVLAVEPPTADGGEGGGQRAVAAAGRTAAFLLAREPRLDAAALKRRLTETDSDPMWRARR